MAAQDNGGGGGDDERLRKKRRLEEAQREFDEILSLGIDALTAVHGLEMETLLKISRDALRACLLCGSETCDGVVPKPGVRSLCAARLTLIKKGFKETCFSCGGVCGNGSAW